MSEERAGVVDEAVRAAARGVDDGRLVAGAATYRARRGQRAPVTGELEPGVLVGEGRQGELLIVREVLELGQGEAVVGVVHPDQTATGYGDREAGHVGRALATDLVDGDV